MKFFLLTKNNLFEQSITPIALFQSEAQAVNYVKCTLKYKNSHADRCGDGSLSICKIDSDIEYTVTTIELIPDGLNKKNLEYLGTANQPQEVH